MKRLLIHGIDLLLFLRIPLLALVQSCDCPKTFKVTMDNMYEIILYLKSKLDTFVLEYTVIQQYKISQ